MEKKFSVQGKNGVVNGVIRITKNYTSHTKEVTHAITHDEVVVTTKYHKVEAFIEEENIYNKTHSAGLNKVHAHKDVLWKVYDKIDSEKTLEDMIFTLESEFERELTHLANHTKEKTFEEKMREKGYV